MRTAYFGGVGNGSNIPASEYLMPPPNGVNDLPAYEAIRSLAAVTGGTIKFRTGRYKSPIGFNLENLQGISLQGTGSTLNGLTCTTLENTGPRTPDSAIVRFNACDNCYLLDVGLVAKFGGCEFGFLVTGDGILGDSTFCYAYNIHTYGNAAGARHTTSATSVNLSTAINVATAITLVSTAGSYPIGTRILVTSRSGGGFMYGVINSLVGNVLTFTPSDVFGTATLSDWDVIQPINGFTFSSTQLCAVDRCEATLCYNGFQMNGVGGTVGPSNVTASPLGPSYRVDGSSSYIKLFGVAEHNSRYGWTVAVFASGAQNLEVAVGMGDDHSYGTPYVLRSVRTGFVHNLNAQANISAAAAPYIIEMVSCNGVKIDTVKGEFAGGGGSLIRNVSGNGACSATNLFSNTVGIGTFASNNFAGFDEWYDLATNFLNNNFLSVQRLNARFGVLTAAVAMNVPNGLTVNRSLTSGLQLITGPTAPFTLSGFAPPEDGKRISFIYLGSQVMTLAHEASSTAANQLKCPGGVDLVLTAPAGGFIYFDILYSSAVGKWLVIPMTYGP